MTLDTKIGLMAPVPLESLRDRCNELLGAADAKPMGPEAWYSETRWVYGNAGNQGLPAWLMIYYSPDGPLPEEEDRDEIEEQYRNPTGMVMEVSFDTAYGYRGPNGSGCGDLHAWLVSELGAWLDERRVPWCWQNEFSGEWFFGTEGLDQLGNAKAGKLSP